ncbi:hypothetical protein GZH49_26240 [Nocardia terpenica]|uniref:hypothetical protein n=1 Tax=Nocardia terpenica TaxID=455432 RepID=UPI002FE329A5
MGFVIRYRLAFHTGSPAAPLLRVSNDALAGGLLLDAAVTTQATLGPHATTFDITLWDLPADNARGLAEACRSRVGTDTPLLVDIELGYFDRPAPGGSPVLRGAVTEVRAEVAADGSLLTRVKGAEFAGYQLLRQRFSYHKPGQTEFGEICAAVQAATTVPVLHDGVTGTDTDLTLADTTALNTLGLLAARAGAPLAVRAGKAVLGTVSDPLPPVRFDPAVNVVSKKRWDSGAPDLQAAPGATTRYELTVLGDPALQIGAPVVLDGDTGRDLRLETVRHLFSLRAGYTCEVALLDAAAAKRPDAVQGPQAVVDGLQALTRGVLTDHPAVDIGDIAAYTQSGDGDTGGHRATLNYGRPQPPASAADDATDDGLQLHDRPIASVFAWDRTGLMVPVYPGMRAVLLHDSGEVDNAIAAGFVWSRHAGHRPPRNQPGDYWLCLPTEVSDGRPSGKGVNDLTDAAGYRVVQAAGLDIHLGAELLPEVGERPTPPSAAALTIRHGAGTTITVADDGAVRITTDGKDLEFGNGSASIAIRGGEITLTATTIKLAASAVEVG